MKKLVAFLLFSLSCFAQGTLSLSNAGTAPAGGYSPGATVALNVTKSGNPTATGLQFDLGSAAGVASITLATGPAAPAGKSASCAIGSQITCLIVGLDSNVIPDGVVGVATITLAASVASSPVNVTLANPIESDGGGNSIPVTVQNPTVSLLIRSRCDVNGDGSVSLSDLSTVVSQAIAKATTAATDLNSDGKTNILDAQIVGTAANGVCNAR